MKQVYTKECVRCEDVSWLCNRLGHFHRLHVWHSWFPGHFYYENTPMKKIVLTAVEIEN